MITALFRNFIAIIGYRQYWLDLKGNLRNVGEFFNNGKLGRLVWFLLFSKKGISIFWEKAPSGK